MLSNNIGKDVTMGVILNNDTFNGLAIHSTVLVKYSTTVAAAGSLKLNTGDLISVYGYCKSAYQISKQSTLFIRYHDNPLSAPGFFYTLEKAILLPEASTKLILGEWIKKEYGQFASSSGFHDKVTDIQVPVTGVYMVNVNVIASILQRTSKLEVRINVNKQKVSSVCPYLISISTATANLNDMLHLQAGSVIEIEVIVSNTSKVNIIASSWSMLLLKLSDTSVNLFILIVILVTTN